MVAQASLAEGRTISMTVYVRLTPPETSVYGDTDAATEIGRGLIRESMRLLKTAAEAEGFDVFMEVQSRIY